MALPPALAAVPRRGRYFLAIAAVAIGYFITVKLSYRIPLGEVMVLPIWPPAGYCQALTVWLGYGIWPGFTLGSLAIAVTSDQSFGVDGLFASVNNTLQPLLGLWLLRRGDFSPSLSHLRDVGSLSLLGAVIPATVSATLGVTYCCLTGAMSWGDFGTAWFNWWIGNVTGVLCLVPLLLTFHLSWRVIRSFYFPPFILLWLVLLAGISWFVFCFSGRMAIAPYPLEYLPFPLIVWGALRLGPWGAAVGTALVTGIATWGITQGNGPFLELLADRSDASVLAVLSLQAYICVLVFMGLVLAAVMAERERARRELQDEKDKSEQLLLNILPQPIADRLKQKTDTIADQFAEVTVLFADIVDFTLLSQRLNPTELVVLLNDVFSTFDQLADQHQLEKIKTIGDAYMAVGGLPYYRDDHAIAIAELALDMQTAVAQFSHLTHQPLQLRIGINTGPVVAGVIGTKKFIYDLWGDTVNTASRMESFGMAGEIQVTESTYEALKHHYQFEPRGEIAVKGKGTMATFLLRDRLPVDVHP